MRASTLRRTHEQLSENWKEIAIAQRPTEGGKGGGRVVVKARWDGISSQCLAPVVEGEAMDVTLWTEEKKNGKTSKTRQVEDVVDRHSDIFDPLQSERGYVPQGGHRPQ
jgi:hypothetical protein